MAFQKATRKKAKLRLALTGPSGSGKTWGALQIAKGLGGKIACIDTEKGSASLYENIVDFDVQELSAPYTPEAYIRAIREAEAAGYDTLIIDSTTHEWNGPGGCLELLEDIAKAKYRGNTWSAWSELTPRHRAFIDAMLQSQMHIIATGRSKTETAQVEENGRKKVAKLGMKTEQRDGFEYEFTVVLDIIHDGHYAVASKDRTGLFCGDAKPLSMETGVELLQWLETGTDGPNVEAILTSIANATDVKVLRGHHDAAIAMLPTHLHQQIKDAANKRRSEIAPPKSKAADDGELSEGERQAFRMSGVPH
jgi:hypothetical protein